MRIAAAALIGLLLCSLVAVEGASGSASRPLVDRSDSLPSTDLEGGRARPQHAGEEKPEKPEKKHPAEKTVKVTGSVVDRDGTPLARAEVSFEGPQGGSAWTDSDGAFEFEGPTGDYRVTVKSGGKSQTFSAKITKSGLEPSRLEFNKD